MQCIMGYVPMIHKIAFVATKGQALIRNTERAPLLVPSLSVQNKSYETLHHSPYARGRAQCRQSSRQNGYHHLNNRFPRLPLHNV